MEVTCNDELRLQTTINYDIMDCGRCNRASTHSFETEMKILTNIVYDLRRYKITQSRVGISDRVNSGDGGWMAIEQDGLIIRFQDVINSAVRYVSKLSTLIDAEDLYQYACLRILLFGRGEAGWSYSDRIRSTDPKTVDRYVQRALTDDLLNYLNQNNRERGEAPPIPYESERSSPEIGTVTLQEYRDGMRPAESSGQLNDLESGTQLDDYPSLKVAVPNQSMLNFLDEKFPVIMLYANGLSERQVAVELKMTRDKVRHLMIKERGNFIKWLHENTNDPFVQKLKEKFSWL